MVTLATESAKRQCKPNAEGSKTRVTKLYQYNTVIRIEVIGLWRHLTCGTLITLRREFGFTGNLSTGMLALTTVGAFN